jgi:hypothetical protein
VSPVGWMPYGSSQYNHRVDALGVRNDPCGLMLYGWNICKSRVDAPSYRNNKSSVDVLSKISLVLMHLAQ